MTPRVKKIALVYFANQPGGVVGHMHRIASRLSGEAFSFKIILCSAVEDVQRDVLIAGGGVDPRDIIVIPHAHKRWLFPVISELTDIFRREQFDVVDAFDDQTQILAGVAARLAGIKVVLCHCEGRFSPSTVSFPKRVLYRVVNFFLKDYFSRSITVSQGLAQELLQEKLRPAKRIEVVHLGISLPSQTHLTYSGLDQGKPVIGAVSRLSVEKGLDRFIKAAVLVLKEVPSARFVITGDGKEKGPLEALARECGIAEKFEFCPWVQDVPSKMATYDIYVLPSLREGLPITLLEAMAVGRPSIASDIDGVREVIDHGIDGILVDTKDPAAFARAIVSLCLDPKKAAEMGQRAFDKVRRSFDVEREMRRLSEIYFEISGRTEA